MIKIFPVRQFEAVCELCGWTADPDYERSEVIKQARKHRREDCAKSSDIVSLHGGIIARGLQS